MRGTRRPGRIWPPGSWGRGRSLQGIADSNFQMIKKAKGLYITHLVAATAWLKVCLAGRRHSSPVGAGLNENSKLDQGKCNCGKETKYFPGQGRIKGFLESPYRGSCTADLRIVHRRNDKRMPQQTDAQAQMQGSQSPAASGLAPASGQQWPAAPG